jgi:hypothetical protein
MSMPSSRKAQVILLLALLGGLGRVLAWSI